MKKVLLFAPLTAQYSGIRNYGAPSIGVHRLASYINSHDHYVVVYDSNIHSTDYLNSLFCQHFDIIGISVLNDTLLLSLEMFIKLRSIFPKALLVAGGAEAILNYQEFFDNTDIDAVVLGEGEIPLLELCNEKPVEQIQGLIYRHRGREVNSSLLWDYYKDIDFIKMGWREYWVLNEQNVGDSPENKKERIVRLVTSSHCNRGCSFCSVTRIHEFSCGRRIAPAYLSGDQVNILIDRVLAQLPETTGIYFVEDSILPTIARLDEFCNALSKYKGRLKFLVQTETDKVSRDTIKKLASAGVTHISFGVENCSPRIRKLMHKPQNSEKIENIIEWCQEFNIRCYYLIILFSPESTINDLQINYETLNRWMTDGRVTVSVEPFMMPYRGASIWYEDYEMAYKIVKLSNGKVLKHPYIIYPKVPQVRVLVDRFKERLPEYLAKMNVEEGHKHQSKDYTGKVMVRLLGDLLNE
ncbi:MAG: radical SAM protein [Planctomycetota bacterium]|nr:radical SAM protein [Planctomycetota bacterium]